MKSMVFVGPKSICTCGHTGDGENSEHHILNDMILGEGHCDVPNCPCERFTWARFTKKYQNFLNTRGVYENTSGTKKR